MNCGHSPYWTGAYGTCMACRAEKAEADLAAKSAECEKLKAELELSNSISESHCDHRRDLAQQLSAETAKRQEAEAQLDMEKCGRELAQDLAEKAAAERDSLRSQVAMLRDALGVLIGKYVANIGTEHEFISCITPHHASDMTEKQRNTCPIWKAWDKARAVLAATEPKK